MISGKNVIYQKLARLFLLLSLLFPQFVCAQDVEYAEYEIKVRFLDLFASAISWPGESTESDSSQPFVIGVLGENPFENILDEAYKNRKIKNRKVEIKYFSDPAQITECNLLFISGSEKDGLLSVLSQINEKPILTVSDSKGFAKKGVHINLYGKNNAFNYEINQSGIVKSGFSVWAHLLSLAKIVNPVEE